MSVIKKDTILVCSYGCYSDYGYEGPVRVVKDFDQATVVDEFRKDHSQENGPDAVRWGGTHDFLPWLVKKGYAEDSGLSADWFLGAYEFEPRIFPDEEAPAA